MHMIISSIGMSEMRTVKTRGYFFVQPPNWSNYENRLSNIVRGVIFVTRQIQQLYKKISPIHVRLIIFISESNVFEIICKVCDKIC